MSHDQNRRGDGQQLPHASGEHVAPPGPDAQPAAASAQTTPPAEPPAPPPSGGPTAQEVQPQPAQGDGRPTAAGTHGGPATHVHADGRASDGATGGAPQASAPAPALPYGQTGAPPPVANISLPNLLTGIRCICVLVLALMLVWPFGGPFLTGALVIFAFAALTDWLDGQLARALNMQTDLGRMLDHMADKLLVCVTLLSMCAAGLLDGLNAFAAALIVAREIFISGLREHLSGRGVVVPPS
ncbi:MAG: CDP-alcohol phosphatidyltransferase family protein, partial [Pseudomonadota bacterium]